MKILAPSREEPRAEPRMRKGSTRNKIAAKGRLTASCIQCADEFVFSMCLCYYANLTHPRYHSNETSGTGSKETFEIETCVASLEI